MDLDFIKFLIDKHGLEISDIHFDPVDWDWINHQVQSAFSADELYQLQNIYDNSF